MVEALKGCKADVGIEVFGDSPLIDPVIVDSLVEIFLKYKREYDFVSNDLRTTYPPGTEAEVFSVAALEDSHRRVSDPAIREHGTLFIRQHPELYRLHGVEAPPELSFPEIEIELDSPEDFEVIKAIYENLYPHNRQFSTCDVIAFLRARPDLMSLNNEVPRRWKEFRNQ